MNKRMMKVAVVMGLAASTAAMAGDKLTQDVQQLREEVRAVLREELDAALARAGHSPPASSARAPEAKEPTAESLKALARGERLVAEGIASRRWTQKQAEALRGLLSQLSEAQRRQLLQKLLPAINRGEVTVDAQGMPF